MFTRIRSESAKSAAGQRDCRIVTARSTQCGNFMANSTSHAGFVRNTARLAHALLRDQVLAVLAPVYLVRHRGAIVETARGNGERDTCGPTRAIDLQPTGIGRS